MRYALISDIHANLPALTAVLRDIAGRDVAAHLADLLVQTADSLEGAAATLTNRFHALDFARDVRRLVREGERAYGDAMGTLLAAAPDPLGAVRQAELYRTLRESLRAGGRAADLVERIALKRF